MKSVAIIGGGISGLSIAHCLKEKYQVKVFEKESMPGGLIKCIYVNNILYHTVGGHVFNSHHQEILNWFWTFFDKEKEFIKASRNAIISMTDGKLVEYPIENHVYMLDQVMMKNFICDLKELLCFNYSSPANFEDFLQSKFGKTLYDNYFKPYNEKIWRRKLKDVPLSWLEGKLPMPTVEEIIFNNFNHIKEKNMVHSSFYYPKLNGSQFIADRMSEKLDIVYNSEITQITRKNKKWTVDNFECDKIIFCGNVKDLPSMLGSSIDTSGFIEPIHNLEYHGTTSVLCEIAPNPYSWIYMPSSEHLSHRIICTGNFSSTNNADGKMSGTIEFTDYISKENIEINLQKIPFSPKYLSHQYTQYTYPIQDTDTRIMINKLKEKLQKKDFFLLGRFAEWEYYNMDAAMGAAIKLSKGI